MNRICCLSIFSGAMVASAILSRIFPERVDNATDKMTKIAIIIPLFGYFAVPDKSKLITTITTAYLGGFITGLVLSDITPITKEIFTTACSQLSILKRIC